MTVARALIATVSRAMCTYICDSTYMYVYNCIRTHTHKQTQNYRRNKQVHLCAYTEIWMCGVCACAWHVCIHTHTLGPCWIQAYIFVVVKPQQVIKIIILQQGTHVLRPHSGLWLFAHKASAFQEFEAWASKPSRFQ